MWANLKVKAWERLILVAVKLGLVEDKCPQCGHLNDPTYETKDKYHCSNCARRWYKPAFRRR